MKSLKNIGALINLINEAVFSWVNLYDHRMEQYLNSDYQLKDSVLKFEADESATKLFMIVAYNEELYKMELNDRLKITCNIPDSKEFNVTKDRGIIDKFNVEFYDGNQVISFNKLTSVISHYKTDK